MKSSKSTPKPRKCRCGCKVLFTPTRPLQTVATPDCALKLIERRKTKEQSKQDKIERQLIRERKEALRPMQYWLKRTEKAVNAWVRERDRDQPCISCGTFDASEWHSGHFLSVGACSSQRFNEVQIRKQCSKCNTHLSGNLIRYEESLVALIGLEAVDNLKNAPRSYKWTREELQAIEAEYKAKLKELAHD